jgi:hypothetical protein
MSTVEETQVNATIEELLDRRSWYERAKTMARNGGLRAMAFAL